MAFHIPFNQRHPKPTGPPVYIGFERPKKSLLVSVNGMRKRKGPRKAAAAGTAISLFGIALAGTIVYTVMQTSHQHQQIAKTRRMAAAVAQQRSNAKTLVASAIEELAQYRDSHDGFLPSVIDSNMLVIKHTDPWGEELRFDLKKDHGVVRSAGPDKVFETSDDITVRVVGKVEAEMSLLPL